MVLHRGGPLCQSLHEMESYPVFFEQSATPSVPLLVGPWVCDGLKQTHIAMKQHCMEGS